MSRVFVLGFVAGLVFQVSPQTVLAQNPSEAVQSAAEIRVSARIEAPQVLAALLDAVEYADGLASGQGTGPPATGLDFGSRSEVRVVEEWIEVPLDSGPPQSSATEPTMRRISLVYTAN